LARAQRRLGRIRAAPLLPVLPLLFDELLVVGGGEKL
jgi:hypothetical protein